MSAAHPDVHNGRFLAQARANGRTFILVKHPAAGVWTITGDGTGTITKYVYAGPPDRMTTIPLLTRDVRVTAVQQQGSAWHITGVVTNQTQLQKGEDSAFDIRLDPSRNLAQSSFFGSSIVLDLKKFSTSS